MNPSESENIISSIKAVGIEISNIYDLVNSRRSYKAAIPILIAAVKNGISSLGLKEGVIRALGTNESVGTEAGQVLISEFWKIPQSEEIMRWVIGNTISIIADVSLFNEIKKIVTDPANGDAREMFVFSLHRINTMESEELLIQMLDDEMVTAHALGALGKLKAIRARGRITPFIAHPNKLVQMEARKALARIDKSDQASRIHINRSRPE